MVALRENSTLQTEYARVPWSLKPIRGRNRKPRKLTPEKAGLYVAGLRYYSPALGRWASRDPLANIDSPNRYLYCTNDPVNAYDPLGLDAYFLVESGHFATMVDDPDGAGIVTYDFQMAQRGDPLGEYARYRKKGGSPGKALVETVRVGQAAARIRREALYVFRVKTTVDEDRLIVAEMMSHKRSAPVYGRETGVCVQRGMEVVEAGTKIDFPVYKTETEWILANPKRLALALYNDFVKEAEQGGKADTPAKASAQGNGHVIELIYANHGKLKKLKRTGDDLSRIQEVLIRVLLPNASRGSEEGE